MIWEEMFSLENIKLITYCKKIEIFSSTDNKTN